MADECLTKPCAHCGRIIHGGNWYCPACQICICLTCGYDIYDCPKCGRKLD